MLTYVTASIIIQALGVKDVIDESSVALVQSTLDVPTMLVLIVYAGLSIRLEVSKPKYKMLSRHRRLIDNMLVFSGAGLMIVLLLIKYWP